jgi:hypothetical protein
MNGLIIAICLGLYFGYGLQEVIGIRWKYWNKEISWKYLMKQQFLWPIFLFCSIWNKIFMMYELFSEEKELISGNTTIVSNCNFFGTGTGTGLTLPSILQSSFGSEYENGDVVEVDMLYMVSSKFNIRKGVTNGKYERYVEGVIRGHNGIDSYYIDFDDDDLFEGYKYSVCIISKNCINTNINKKVGGV